MDIVSWSGFLFYPIKFITIFLSMKRFTVALFILSMSLSGYSTELPGTGSIKGLILEKTSGIPLEFATGLLVRHELVMNINVSNNDNLVIVFI